MDVSEVLFHILVVLVAAKAAAELADRIGVPPVVAEITAGILIGPSVLGLVEGDEVLRVLGELGVILLLLEVGLEMDVAELGTVGGAALRVASLGVIAPFISGTLVGLGFGMEAKEAIFVGAALTATSVGITARVFGDLRMLATVEARTVLGAAVADDVMGLVILTVVTRLVTEGSVSAFDVFWLVFVAVAFLVVTTWVGVRVVPPLFSLVARYSRSAGTLVAIALAFTLGVAELADAVKLAPIVGAFVAGLALARSPAAGRVRRELAPVGHLFIPVFFLQIGIDVEVREFADGKVLATAAALLAVAVVGKVLAGVAVRPGPGDKLLVGLGMLPRGEVGLIFAALGLREAVFGRDVYASLLLVVLATTMLAPPLLRWRSQRVRTPARARGTSTDDDDGGGSPGALELVDGKVVLRAEPSVDHALATVLAAARLCSSRPADDSLLDWIAEYPPSARRFDADARDNFAALLREGTPRSWRLLVMSGVLDRALPELADALGAHQHEHAFDVDPLARFATPRLSSTREDPELPALADPDAALVAALVLDACDDTDADAVAIGRRTAARAGFGLATEERTATLLADIELFAAAARRGDAFEPASVTQLAVHLGSGDHARALHLLARVSSGDEDERVTRLYALVQQELAGRDVAAASGADEVERRRVAARALTDDPEVRERIDAAPRDYVLQVLPSDLARHAALCEPTPRGDTLRVAVQQSGDTWLVEIAARDRLGFMAHVARVFAERSLDVVGAIATTYGDDTAFESYRVLATEQPETEAIAARLRELRREPPVAGPVPEAVVTFDDVGSPWSTRCTIEADDQPGLLQAITTAFLHGGATVRAARITTEGDSALDTFDLTLRDGRKLDARTKTRVVDALHDGAAPARRARRTR
jgi:Kef-type K+ transport system membrane component KefB